MIHVTPLPSSALNRRDSLDPVRTATPAPCRIVLVDDHPIVREGLKRLIACQPDLQVVGEARDGEEALKATHELRPDIVILDLMMPGVDGLVAARRLKESRPQTKIIGLSMAEDINWIAELVRLGAEGFVVKRAASVELVAAIREVQKGGVCLDHRVSAQLLEPKDHDALHPKEGLSAREEGIIRLIAQGYSNKEIAAQLDLSVKTVETYKARGMEKTGLRNRVEIIRHGAKRGWLADLSDALTLCQESAQIGINSVAAGSWSQRA